MTNQAKILVVDDNANNRLSIRTILKGIDAELHEPGDPDFEERAVDDVE